MCVSPQLSPESRSKPSGHNTALICPGDPRRSCRRSFGACAGLSRISAICLLAAASSQGRHIVQIRCRRRSEWCGSDCRIAFCLASWGCIASDRTPHLIGWLSLWCRQDSNLHGCFPRSVLRNLHCPTTISPPFCVVYHSVTTPFARSFPTVILL